MQEPPVRSIGEVTSNLSTAADDHPSTSSDQDKRATGAEGGRSQPQSPSPTVLSWEQLSGYTGFKPLDVQAGLQASLRMFVLHTQQIFFRETKNYDELMCQVCKLECLCSTAGVIPMGACVPKNVWQCVVLFPFKSSFLMAQLFWLDGLCNIPTEDSV